MIKKDSPNQKKQQKQNTLDFGNFQCKLVKKINLNERVQQDMQIENPEIGSAWSGINYRPDGIPIFYYGTQNGILVRLQMENLAQNTQELSNQQVIDEGQQQQTKKKEKGDPFLIKELAHQINRLQSIKDVSKQCQLDNQESQNDHILKIKAYKIYEENQPCYQVGQINKCIILSGKDQGGFQLRIFDQNFNLLETLKNQVASQHFTRTLDNILIFRNTISLQQSSEILFSKVVNQKLKLYKNKISFHNNSIFPTIIIAKGDILFVGLYQKMVYVYSIKKRKLIKVINPQIEAYVKKLAYNESSKVLVVLSLEDQMSFINLVNGEIIIQYRLSDIFRIQNIEFQNEFEIFLFNFVNKDVVLIGGSFNKLFFFDWKQGKVLKQYVDYANFVGAIFYNNFIYLTHEKSSYISIIQ